VLGLVLPCLTLCVTKTIQIVVKFNSLRNRKSFN